MYYILPRTDLIFFTLPNHRTPVLELMVQRCPLLFKQESKLVSPLLCYLPLAYSFIVTVCTRPVSSSLRHLLISLLGSSSKAVRSQSEDQHFLVSFGCVIDLYSKYSLLRLCCLSRRNIVFTVASEEQTMLTFLSHVQPDPVWHS